MAKNNPDYLRVLDNVLEPDPRSFLSSGVNLKTKETFLVDIEHHHRKISRFILHCNVPEGIIVQFETVKNLYLYAWFVYRFYPISQFQALVCLELALRERFESELEKNRQALSEDKSKKKKHSLFNYLNFAIQEGYIKNEDFSDWHNIVRIRCCQRNEREIFQEILDKGLSYKEWNDDDFVVKDEDKDFDFIGPLKSSLIKTRNLYGHGTKALHKEVINTIKIVCEIINKIYEEPKKDARCL